jgi:hypothetical protein
MQKIVAAILVAITFAACAPGIAQTGRDARPKDECLHVVGYFDLRQKFEDIVKRRDSIALFAMLSPTITSEIGGAEGRDNFARAWNLAAGKASPIWPQLDKILRLGCVADSDMGVMMPHLTGLDPHQNGNRVTAKALVLGANINLRAGPATTAVVIDTLSWKFVEIPDEAITPAWTRIKTMEGKTGYINSNFLRAYLDYRISFSRQNNIWTLDVMYAGD